MIRLAALVALLLVAAPAHAQQDLDTAMQRVARMWERGDVRGITQSAASAGFALELESGRSGPVASRQAAAALRRLFEDQQTVSVKPGVARVSGGRPQRAFGELEWITRPRGTTIPERRTVFVALVREEQGWRVTEIRVMP
ncbi:MAG: hypothetical protein GX539_13390 [Candidatus Cloacimonetes bacterium]|jgi:hypothetical protein|nr:hypothetical protein [Candidatus Cloacimonadota bacterium]